MSAGHTFTVPVLDVNEVPLLWVVQQVIIVSFASMSGVSQWPLPSACRNIIKTKLSPFQLNLELINQEYTFHPDEVYFGSQPGTCGNT